MSNNIRMRPHELDLNTIAKIGLIRHHTSYHAKIIKHITLNIQVIASIMKH
jgi:hypothetical protein